MVGARTALEIRPVRCFSSHFRAYHYPVFQTRFRERTGLVGFVVAKLAIPLATTVIMVSRSDNRSEPWAHTRTWDSRARPDSGHDEQRYLADLTTYLPSRRRIIVTGMDGCSVEAWVDTFGILGGGCRVDVDIDVERGIESREQASCALDGLLMDFGSLSCHWATCATHR